MRGHTWYIGNRASSTQRSLVLGNSKPESGGQCRPDWSKKPKNNFRYCLSGNTQGVKRIARESELDVEFVCARFSKSIHLDLK
jgi:hypothetical protein